jgi:hypothetical protein
MEATKPVERATRHHEALFAMSDEIAELSAHINAATARWLDLVMEYRREGGTAIDGCERWLAWRCGISTREAREYVRVAESLEELPLTRAAFRRGELTFTKVRALTRVASPRDEQGLLDLAGALTASQLERALRAYRRVHAKEAGDTHEFEYVDYYWTEDGSLVLRARLPAEDGTVLVRALEAARERVRERRREEGVARPDLDPPEARVARLMAPPRSANIEALVNVAEAALAGRDDEPDSKRSGVVVHVDASALTADGPGRCEVEDGPVIAPETARRLSCDADAITSLEHEGLPLSVGRKRRTVPPKLRRLLNARDDGCCRWPGCESRRHLAAHHRHHWAHGGETSLDNLLLLCWQHHRLVHEGGYTIEEPSYGELRFRNRYGLLVPTIARPPPGDGEQLIDDNRQARLTITAKTNRNGDGDPMNLDLAVCALTSMIG